MHSTNNNWRDISQWLRWWISAPGLPVKQKRIIESYYMSYIRSFPAYISEHYARQSTEITELASKLSRPKILDIGCGCGIETMWFAISTGADVTGIDIKENRIDAAKTCLRHLKSEHGIVLDVKFLNCNIFDLTASEEYDIVWMEQAFHHIEPRDNICKVLAKTLRPGGHIVISEANALNPFMQLSLFFKRGVKTKRHKIQNGEKIPVGNERIVTARKLASLLRSSGFIIESSRYYRTLPNICGIERWSWIERLIPGWLVPAYTHYNIKAKKG